MYMDDIDDYLKKIEEITGAQFNIKGFATSKIPFIDELQKVQCAFCNWNCCMLNCV